MSSPDGIKPPDQPIDSLKVLPTWNDVEAIFDTLGVGVESVWKRLQLLLRDFRK